MGKKKAKKIVYPKRRSSVFEFGMSRDLLETIEKKSPKFFSKYLSDVEYEGEGIHSLACVDPNLCKVYKFTTNVDEVWADWLIMHNPKPHLAKIYNVFYLARPKIFLIISEYLNTKKMKGHKSKIIYRGKTYKWCDLITKELSSIGIGTGGLTEECVRQNGRSKRGVYKCFDFGFSEFEKPIRIKKIPVILD